MTQQPIILEPKYIFDLIIRRRWYVIVPFSLSLIVGTYLVITLPKIYEAQTLIMVEPQRVPQNYVRSIVSMDITSRISTISQQIMSRSNLEKVIEDFDLFSDMDNDFVYLEDKLASLRRRIKVNVSSQRRGTDAFSISFKGTSPYKVMRVTNALASYFIDENLKFREEQAIGTSDFLDTELKAMRNRLEDKESELQHYKQRFMGALPEQLQTNLSILNSLRDQKNEKQLIIRSIEDNIFNLKKSSNSFVALNNDLLMDDFVSDFDDGGSESYELNQLRESLEQLKSKYTDKHPDVAQIKRRIEELENNQESEDEEVETVIDQPDFETALPTIDLTAVQMAELRSFLKNHQQELKEIDRQIEIYSRRVEETPQREQEIFSIQRDYDNLNSLYESLLSRKLESEIAVNMERRKKGEQFRLLDVASLPEKPISPNMKRIFVLVLTGGLGIGVGLIFLLEYLDTSYKRPQDAEDELGLNVLCNVPQLIDARQARMKRLEKAGFLVFGILSLGLFTLFTLLTLKGDERSLEMIKKIIT